MEDIETIMLRQVLRQEVTEELRTAEKRDRSSADLGTPTSSEKQPNKRMDLGSLEVEPPKRWENEMEAECEGGCPDNLSSSLQTKPEALVNPTEPDPVIKPSLNWEGSRDLLLLMDAAIKKAVSEAIKPLEDEIRKLKTVINNIQPATKSLMSDLFKKNTLPPPPQTKPNQPTISSDIQLARRTLGFNPITTSHINNHYNPNNNHLSTSEQFQLAGTRALEDFMDRDMHMPHSTIARLRTKRVFHPQSGSGSNTFYVEYESENDVAAIKRYAHNLTGQNPGDPKITMYVPKSLQKQHSELQQAAFTARRLTPKMSTKIWLGDTMELRIKKAGNNQPWHMVEPVNLAEFWKVNRISGKSNLPNPTQTGSGLPTTPTRSSAANHLSSTPIPTSNTFNGLEDPCTS